MDQANTETSGTPDASAAAAAAPAPAPKVKTVKVRVLTDCAHGKCDTVAELPADVAKQAEEGGLVDTNKAAVAACAAAAADQ
jgi:hypothetical protein